MTTTPVNAYLRTRVMTAPPEQLRLLLLEGAVKFASQGREGMAAKNFEQMFTGISQCRDIVVELMTSIREDVEPELTERVRSLYAFIYSELTAASLERDLVKMDSVIKLLDYERETWVMLLEKLAAERGAGKAEADGRAPSISVNA